MNRSNLLAVMALPFVLSVSMGAATATPHAIYDPATGNIEFCGLDGQQGVVIRSQSGALIGGNGLLFGQIYDDILSPFALTWADFRQPSPPAGLWGNFVAGSIVHPHTPISDLTFEYVKFGQPVTIGEIVPQNLEGTHECPIPEPSSCLLLEGACLVSLLKSRFRSAAS